MQDEQDDITLDNETGIDDSVLAEEAQGDAIKKLKIKLREAETKAKENLDNWQRAQAEFLNLRKKDEESKIEFLRFAKSELILELITVLDSFNQALSHGQEDVKPIYGQFMGILKSAGLEEVDPKGKIFDPKEHEAVSMKKTDRQEEDHVVLKVLQKGYAMGGKVIRPAKVIVGEFVA
ncbi:MAG: molecular chaperone GrpE [Parcubacteria bacterium C7867-005]|nr:MAG: molecular chaperone GrpE [Parcubacteria bacterium C7867-005]